jgi:hypothetical protein
LAVEAAVAVRRYKEATAQILLLMDLRQLVAVVAVVLGVNLAPMALVVGQVAAQATTAVHLLLVALELQDKAIKVVDFLEMEALL